ncbi:MAG: T9SS type A sorting domain-containing protein [Flavobacterium sp.]|nr:T9SS type A sorting domain-containing protein [Flavobacterium sp.]
MKKNYLLVMFLLSLTNMHSQMIGGVDVSNLPNNLHSTSAPSADCDVQFSFQTSSPSPSGLCFDGTYLYSTAGDLPFIDKYSLDGQLVASIPIPLSSSNFYGGDLDFDGTNLWLMAEQHGILYKMNPLNGEVLSALTISSASDPNYASCAYDNGYLWVNEYFSEHLLLHINATTGVIEDTFNIIPGIISLRIINGDLYGVDYNTDLLHKFDKTTGAILSSTPWCIPNFSLGICTADGSIWGLSGSIVYGGSQSIKRFESSLLSNDSFESSNIEITVLPNPASDVINIKAASTSIIGFEIFNVLGGSIARKNCDGIGEISFDISNFQNGIYFIKVATKNGSYVKKYIKI